VVLALIVVSTVHPADPVLTGRRQKAYHTICVASGETSAVLVQPVVLFDNTHAETAGNADWTITGGYSAFADTLREHGFEVRSLDSGSLDESALSGVSVVVLPEPNGPLTTQELSAITRFVRLGGGLFAIADHGGADRDNDGWDSVKVLNELTRPMGILFKGDWISEAPLRGPIDPGHPLTRGVKALGAWGASSLIVNSPEAVTVARFDPAYGSKPSLACVPFGQGRLVALGDSSPFDDGKGAPGKTLYREYGDPRYSMAQLALNAVNHLAGRPFCPVAQVGVGFNASILPFVGLPGLKTLENPGVAR